MVVDGVFIGVNSGAMVKALDLQSVEILRGPQGTLFGRNSIAGVINITRQRPGSELGGEMRAGYGNYNDMQFEAYVNVPASDQLSFKLAGAVNNRDGYFHNLTLGKRHRPAGFLLDQPVDSVAADRKPGVLLPLRPERTGPGLEYRPEHGAA